MGKSHTIKQKSKVSEDNLKAEDIKEIKNLMRDFSNLVGVIREESLYVMEKMHKDKIAKELLPYYSQLLNIFKRSNVFASGDALQSVVTQFNESLEILDKRMTKLEGEVNKLKEGGNKHDWWNKILGK